MSKVYNGGYTANWISTIVDNMKTLFHLLKGYTANWISTIVDWNMNHEFAQDGYTANWISTIVDVDGLLMMHLEATQPIEFLLL